MIGVVLTHEKSYKSCFDWCSSSRNFPSAFASPAFVLKHIMLGFEESFNAYGIVRCTSRNSHFEIPSSLSVADWLSPSAIFVTEGGQGTR